MFWLGQVWTQVDEGGMHQARKNKHAAVGPGLHLSLSDFGGTCTSICIQRLLSGNYEPKYHVGVMAQKDKNIQIVCCTLFLIWRLSIFPCPPNEHLWPDHFNHPSTHKGSSVFNKVLGKKKK